MFLFLFQKSFSQTKRIKISLVHDSGTASDSNFSALVSVTLSFLEKWIEQKKTNFTEPEKVIYIDTLPN